MQACHGKCRLKKGNKHLISVSLFCNILFNIHARIQMCLDPPPHTHTQIHSFSSRSLPSSLIFDGMDFKETVPSPALRGLPKPFL